MLLIDPATDARPERGPLPTEEDAALAISPNAPAAAFPRSPREPAASLSAAVAPFNPLPISPDSDAILASNPAFDTAEDMAGPADSNSAAACPRADETCATNFD